MLFFILLYIISFVYLGVVCNFSFNPKTSSNFYIVLNKFKMTKDKTTLNVSEKLMNSILIGFIISLIIVIIAHFLPINWMVTYDKFTGYRDSTVGMAGYRCSLGGQHSHNFSGTNITVGNQTRDIGMIISDSFDGHGIFILTIGIIASLIIYLSKKVDVKIVKD